MENTENKGTINIFQDGSKRSDRKAKFCGNCGAEIEQGKPFCGNCGQAIECDAASASEKAEKQHNDNFIKAVPEKKKNTKLIIGIVASILLVFMIIGMAVEKPAQNREHTDYIGGELNKRVEVNIDEEMIDKANQYIEDSKNQEYTKGVLTASSYESLYAGLKFTVPQGWAMLTEEEINSQIAEPTDQYIYEMACVDGEGHRVTVMIEKLPTKNFSVDQYMEAVINNGASSGISKIANDKTRMIGETEYKLLECSLSQSGVVVNLDLYIKKLGDRVVCITASYVPGDKERVETAMNCFTKY